MIARVAASRPARALAAAAAAGATAAVVAVTHHTSHTRFHPCAPTYPSTIRWLERFARQQVGSHVVVTATTNGAHTVGSYHYRARAVDFAGSSYWMLRLARAAESPKWRGYFSEVIHSPTGVFVKCGALYPQRYLPSSTVAQHYNHVHLAR